jgi:hypothetical protein
MGYNGYISIKYHHFPFQSQFLSWSETLWRPSSATHSAFKTGLFLWLWVHQPFFIFIFIFIFYFLFFIFYFLFFIFIDQPFFIREQYATLSWKKKKFFLKFNVNTLNLIVNLKIKYVKRCIYIFSFFFFHSTKMVRDNSRTQLRSFSGEKNIIFFLFLFNSRSTLLIYFSNLLLNL